MKGMKGFEAWETIAIGLPHVFQCKRCRHLWHCLHAPENDICQGCVSGEETVDEPTCCKVE